MFSQPLLSVFQLHHSADVKLNIHHFGQFQKRQVTPYLLRTTLTQFYRLIGKMKMDVTEKLRLDSAWTDKKSCIMLFQSSLFTVIWTVQSADASETVKICGGSCCTNTVSNRQQSMLEQPICLNGILRPKHKLFKLVKFFRPWASAETASSARKSELTDERRNVWKNTVAGDSVTANAGTKSFWTLSVETTPNVNVIKHFWR